MKLDFMVYEDTLQYCLWQNYLIVAAVFLKPCKADILHLGADGVLWYLLGAVFCGSWHSRLHLS